MLQDYYIFDDILNNPYDVLSLAKNYDYYSADDKKIDGISINQNEPFRPDGRWKGLRSQHIAISDHELFENIFNTVITNVFNIVGSFSYNIDAFFHYAPEYIEFSEEWWHIDQSALFAGVIYLNPSEPKDSGTLIKDKTGKEIVVQNKFNRLVIYKSHLIHRPMKCFGTSKDNARLTLSFFIKEINFFKNL